MSIPPGTSRPLPASRLLAAETATIRVTVSTVGSPDQVQTFTPVLDTSSGVSKARIEVQTTIGTHTFLVESLDSWTAVLTSGLVTQTLVEGTNQVILSLNPAATLTNGAVVSLAAGQAAYLTVPGASLSLFQLTGANSTFWEGAADGTFPGAGTAGSLTVDVTGGTDKVLRVVQGTAGTFTAVVPQVAAVTFSPPGGTFAQDQTVSLSDTTPGASITYSLDGGTTYLPYTVPIAIAGNGTVKTLLARASALGYTSSTVTSQTYSIQYPQVAAVTFSPPGGTFVEDQLITLSDTTPGASITYSLDGGTTYLPYTVPIAVAGNGTTKTILARATAAGYTASVTTSQTYTVQYSAVTINFALPTEPVILGVNGLVLDANQLDTLTVALDSPAAFSSYTWFIDGTPGQYQMESGWVFNGQAFTQAGNSLVVESQYMTSGLHEVMVIVSDGSGTYSARFSVEVIR